MGGRRRRGGERFASRACCDLTCMSSVDWKGLAVCCGVLVLPGESAGGPGAGRAAWRECDGSGSAWARGGAPGPAGVSG